MFKQKLTYEFNYLEDFFIGDCLRQNLSEYVVVDLETTGLTYTGSEIIEVCALHIKDGEVIGKYSSLVDYPMRKSIPKKITELTGITIDMMREQGSYIEDVLAKLLKFIGNKPILCHNAQFDLGFLYEKFSKYLNEDFDNNFIDTLYISREFLADELDNHKLPTIAEYFDIDSSDCHRAEKDCVITYQVYEALKSNLPLIEKPKKPVSKPVAPIKQPVEGIPNTSNSNTTASMDLDTPNPFVGAVSAKNKIRNDKNNSKLPFIIIGLIFLTPFTATYLLLDYNKLPKWVRLLIITFVWFFFLSFVFLS